MKKKPFAITLDPATSLANQTGSWRTMRPVYVTRLPPCNKACPAGENIQEWLSLAETGDIEGAFREIAKNNPFPAVMGRVCYHTCEAVCNRQEVDTAVSINAVERFIGDEAIRNKWSFAKPAKASGKKILVIGAGPAGLSAAYHMTMLGHKVTIMEALPKAGGMMRYGIPRYRLPEAVLDAEIKRIETLGVTIQCGAKVDDALEAKKQGDFDAVFLSVGAQKPKTTEIPATNGAKILDAVSVLRSMEGKDKPKLGKRVAVYGGGNTALDVARTARRLGAETVTIVYRRTQEKMPAHLFEIEEALEEGVTIRPLSTIKKADGAKLTLEKMKLDDKGLPQPTGKFEEMEADCVVLALGQDADLALTANIPHLDVADSLVQVDQRMRTSYKGFFAGGDMVSNARTVTVAIGHGKKAARQIDLWFRDVESDAAKPSDATPDKLNTWYYEKAPRQDMKMIDMKQRLSSFEEVQTGLTRDEAVSEAGRCLSCGNCFECDNCYGVCPDNAIKKLGPGKGFEIDYAYCKGCALCVSECPCGALEMITEEK